MDADIKPNETRQLLTTIRECCEEICEKDANGPLLIMQLLSDFLNRELRAEIDRKTG